MNDKERYRLLRDVLDRAYLQASVGKGRERHASGEPFEEQLIVRIGHHLGDSTVFNIGQAWKKSGESLRMPKDRAIAELLGAINYLAGAVVLLETTRTGEDLLAKTLPLDKMPEMGIKIPATMKDVTNG